MSRREQILAVLMAVLETHLAAAVRRNEVLPERVPTTGLVILRDGDPGEPDVTLNPRTEFYSHKVELEVYVLRDTTGGGEVALDALLGAIGTALRIDPSIASAPVSGADGTRFSASPPIEGAAPILTARLIVTVEYLVSDPLTA